MTPLAISVQHLVKEYPSDGNKNIRAVDNISFTIQPGQIYGLLGPNGAGKSTTIKILTTLIQPTSGTALINGIDVVSHPLEARRNICVVLQDNAVDAFLSVRNNFITYGKFQGMTRKEIDKQYGKIAELFGLTDVMDQRAMDLSGGMKRRVQVAKIFFSNKPVIFLDEATTGMDTFNKRTTIAAIREEAAKGRTIVLTTHMLEEAEELCDAVTIINHGRVIAGGTTGEIKAMGLQIFYLTLKFKEISNQLKDALEKIGPLKMEIAHSNIELSVREHRVALEVLAIAQQMGSLVHFEISSASLEDVFVELIDAGKGAVS